MLPMDAMDKGLVAQRTVPPIALCAVGPQDEIDYCRRAGVPTRNGLPSVSFRIAGLTPLFEKCAIADRVQRIGGSYEPVRFATTVAAIARPDRHPERFAHKKRPA
jgi:hypothetical protein